MPDTPIAAVYDELRALAEHRLSIDPAGWSLGATGLVHEAYLKLHGKALWKSDRHYFHAAAQAMRRILVDRARAASAEKRGGGQPIAELPDMPAAVPVDYVALDDALTTLAAEDPVAAEMVHLRFFAGRTRDESAQFLGISPRQADRLWAFARAWLFDRLSESGK
jgi:RNA polymerase sigma factor (TIGR02999 family)